MTRPGPGEVQIGVLHCAEEIPAYAEGQVGDLLLANEEVYAIVRTDPASKYFLHVGGGTLVDFGLWDEPEVVGELVPVFSGAWVRSGELVWGQDGSVVWARVEGVAEPIGFLGADASLEASIEFRLSTSGTKLGFSGSDSVLFLGEEGGFLTSSNTWEEDGQRLEMGELLLDLGGAVWMDGREVVIDFSAPSSEEEPGSDLDPSANWRPEGFARVDFQTHAYPSRDSRVDALSAQNASAQSGAALTLLTAIDEVVVLKENDEAPNRVLSASLAKTLMEGSVLSWPWAPKNHRPAHGAIPWEGLGALDVLALAKAGDSRRGLVDLDWVNAAGPMEDWNPVPELVWLDGLSDFHEMRARWNWGASLGFAGPVTWVPVATVELPSLAELERPLLQQRSVAGNGPVLDVERLVGEDSSWDQLTVSVQLDQAQSNVMLSVWSPNHLLDERVFSEAADVLEWVTQVPSHLDVWVSFEGDGWAVSSVRLASRRAAPDLQGGLMRRTDAVFDGDAF